MPEPLTLRSLLKVLLLAVGLLCVFFYTTFQARYLIMGPQIVLIESPTLLNNERTVYLSGETFNISRLWLNDRPIYTDAEGNFQEALVLENGYTVATLRAKDRYGRETEVTRSMVYVPASFVTQHN